MPAIQAKPGDTVRVQYTGKLDDGRVFDQSPEEKPLEFTLGQQQVIPGFENSIVGMNTGDSKSIRLPADDAFGPRRDEMVVIVEKSKLPDEISPEVGKRVELSVGQGETVAARITDVAADSVTFDANHPLAGEDLTFDVRLVEIV